MLVNTVKLTPAEFVELKDIIYNNSGIMFTENKKYLMENRLSKRLAELNFTSFKDYIYYLKYDVKKRLEMDTMINLITINETYFLRERAQVDYLVSTIVPDFIKAGKRSIKIWSVPCSTGEEPYSIAILLMNAGHYNKINIDIMATDINSDVVAIAKRGVYHNASFRGVPADFIAKNFTKDGQSYIIKDEIKNKVRFNTGNITSPTAAILAVRLTLSFAETCSYILTWKAKRKP